MQTHLFKFCALLGRGLTLLGIFAVGSVAFAQENGEAKENGDKKDEKSFAEMVEDKTVLDGLFTLYQDPKTGSLMMAVRKDQLGKEYIYFTHTVEGVVEAGHFRGNFRDNQVFKINKIFNKLELSVENTYFYFDPENALSRAADANISPAVILAEEIAAESEDGETFLIKADGLFLKEALHQVKRSKRPDEKPGERFALGKLSKEKTRYSDVRNYPANTEVAVSYVYDNPAPMNRGNPDITDPRAVTITMQHSLIEMPENDFVPRIDDARVGYFFDRVTDLTSASATPYRDLINRWHLVKKDPTAAVSEPVEPIVWWIENTTPMEYRGIIRESVLAWNSAFEAAGFKNAVQVEVQPDDAEWDAGDVRYNVLRWTSSPNPPFGGYGPSFTNPRTGQIIGADIMLEFVFLTNRLKSGELFAEAALGLDHQSALADIAGKPFFCSLGHNLQHDLMLGRAVHAANGAPGDKTKQLVKEALFYLTLHEAGHTLGLNHNMKASQLYGLADIHDTSKTEETGLISSVMDYPAINFAWPGQAQGQYYTVKPGPYDIWAIQFGYSPDLDDTDARNAHLARSSEPALAFGNDADDMRSAGKAIDPRVMISDMSSDSMGFALRQMELVDDTMAKLKAKYTKSGQSWQAMRDAYLILTGTKQQAARVISRHVGGVYIDRSLAGQEGGGTPYVPVAYEDQKAALDALGAHFFAPDAFEISADLASHLQPQRRGFDFFGATEDPKFHERVLTMHRDVLDHLMHPVVLKRLTDTRLYGNEYSASEFLGDLTDTIFRDDLQGDVNTFRQNLQIDYVKRLIAIVEGDGWDSVSKSAALTNLGRIAAWMSGRDGWFDSLVHGWQPDSRETAAHRRHIAHLIRPVIDG